MSVVATLDFAELTPRKCDQLDVSVPGAGDGDSVALGIPSSLALDPRTTFFGWVSASDTVTVRRCNVARDSAADPAPASVRVDVWKH